MEPKSFFGRMSRVLRRNVVADQRREVLALECGHTIVRAPRKAKSLRLYCPDCNPNGVR